MNGLPMRVTDIRVEQMWRAGEDLKKKKSKKSYNRPSKDLDTTR